LRYVRSIDRTRFAGEDVTPRVVLRLHAACWREGSPEQCSLDVLH
jgi:hypothetical protein